MAYKSKAEIEIETIKSNMINFLSNDKNITEYEKKLVDDYCEFYLISERLKREIKKINRFNNKAKVENMKRNYSINDLVKINKEMTSILMILGLANIDIAKSKKYNDNTI